MPSGQTTVTKSRFGAMPDGTGVELYTLRDGIIEASLTAFGARLTSVKAPDREGNLTQVVLGHDALEPYVADRKTFMGAIVGRVGNRIAHGRFSLDGRSFEVPPNDGDNALHGGAEGFDRKLWRAEERADGVTFTYRSPDGEMGFPGTLEVAVRYSLSEGALRMDYTAAADRATVVNVTNHAYFNLSGKGSGTVLDHELTLPAEAFTPVSASMIPTGALESVEGTPFDFRRSGRIGERIAEKNIQLERAGGYDHNWCFGKKGTMKLAAKLKDPASGRVLTVSTTEPGVQFYSGNFLDGSVPARDGKGSAGYRSGLCLETQGYPDAPNQRSFPSIVLRPGETMRSTTVFAFTVEA